VSFANGLAQPLRVGEATETSNGSVIQVIPDGQVGTISLAGQLRCHYGELMMAVGLKELSIIYKRGQWSTKA